MSALDDFIAQDPVSRDFVNLYPGAPNSDIRWSEMDVRSRTESILESVYSVQAQRILSSKIDVYTLQRQNQLAAAIGLPADPDMVLPPYTLSQAEKQEMSAYGTTRALCGALKDVMWARAQRLTAALDYEAVRAWMATLDPVPEDGSPDPSADLRGQLQAMLDAATPDTLALVAERDAIRNPPEQP